MTDQELEQIEKAADAATPGPWEVPFSLYWQTMQGDFRKVPIEDENLMALARETVPKLVAELRAYKRAKAENDERFMTERDAARADLQTARDVLERIATAKAYVQKDGLEDAAKYWSDEYWGQVDCARAALAKLGTVGT